MVKKQSITEYGRELSKESLTLERIYASAKTIFESGEDVLDEESLQILKGFSDLRDFRKYLVKRWRNEGFIPGVKYSKGAFFEELVDKAVSQGKLDPDDESSRMRFAEWLKSDTEIHNRMTNRLYEVITRSSVKGIADLVVKYYSKMGEPLTPSDYSVSEKDELDMELELITQEGPRVAKKLPATRHDIKKHEIKQKLEQAAAEEYNETSKKKGLTPKRNGQPEEAFEITPGLPVERLDAAAGRLEEEQSPDHLEKLREQYTAEDSLSAHSKPEVPTRTEVKRRKEKNKDAWLANFADFERDVERDLKQTSALPQEKQEDARTEVKKKVEEGFSRLADEAAYIEDPAERREAFSLLRKAEAGFLEMYLKQQEEHKLVLRDIADGLPKKQGLENEPENISESLENLLSEKDAEIPELESNIPSSHDEIADAYEEQVQQSHQQESKPVGEGKRQMSRDSFLRKVEEAQSRQSSQESAGTPDGRRVASRSEYVRLEQEKRGLSPGGEPQQTPEDLIRKKRTEEALKPTLPRSSFKRTAPGKLGSAQAGESKLSLNEKLGKLAEQLRAQVQTSNESPASAITTPNSEDRITTKVPSPIPQRKTQTPDEAIAELAQMQAERSAVSLQRKEGANNVLDNDLSGLLPDADVLPEFDESEPAGNGYEKGTGASSGMQPASQPEIPTEEEIDNMSRDKKLELAFKWRLAEKQRLTMTDGGLAVLLKNHRKELLSPQESSDLPSDVEEIRKGTAGYK